MYWPVQCSVTKCHRLNVSNSRNIFLMIPETGEHKSKILSGLALPGMTFPGVDTGYFLSCYVSTRELEFREGGASSAVDSF